MSGEARRTSEAARGVSAVVRRTPWTWPWNAVEVHGHCRGALLKKGNNVNLPPFGFFAKTVR